MLIEKRVNERENIKNLECNSKKYHKYRLKENSW